MILTDTDGSFLYDEKGKNIKDLEHMMLTV